MKPFEPMHVTTHKGFDFVLFREVKHWAVYDGPDKYHCIFEVYSADRKVEYIGRAETCGNPYETDDPYIRDVSVYEQWHRKGIMTCVYNIIERHIGKTLSPSSNLLADGQAFWSNRLGLDVDSGGQLRMWKQHPVVYFNEMELRT